MLVGSVAAGCFVAACADIFGIHNADVDGSVGDGGGGDVIIDVPYDYAVFDKVPIDANTATCDGGVPVLAADKAFWVSGKHGNDVSGCGTQAAPCKTINYLLPTVTDAGIRTVYLDNSQFLEQLNLGSAYHDFTIQGGFTIDDAGTWTATCANNLTYITAPDEGGVGGTTVYVHNMLDAGVTLRLMQIETKTMGNVGESVYALLVIDSDVLLDNVNLYAQNGGHGLGGANGNAGVGCQVGAGGTGANGTDAGPSGVGTFTTTSSGYVPATANSGTNGALGALISPPGGPACEGGCVTGCN